MCSPVAHAFRPPLIDAALFTVRSFTARWPPDLPFSFFSMASLLETRWLSPVAYGMPDAKARNTAQFARRRSEDPGAAPPGQAAVRALCPMRNDAAQHPVASAPAL